MLGALVVAAGLEAALGPCLGCKMFALLMRVGVIPRDACERCTDLGWSGRGGSGRRAATPAR